jgi:hypothetical protein
MNLRLLLSGLCIWPLEQPGIVEVMVIVSQYQFGSDQRWLRFAIKRVEDGMIQPSGHHLRTAAVWLPAPDGCPDSTYYTLIWGSCQVSKDLVLI